MKERLYLRYSSIFILLSIILLGAGLRFYRLSHQSIWEDEAYSIRTASIGGSALSWGIWKHIHGPLYYLLLHYWGNMGMDEFTLRSLSAILGILSIPAFYLLARELFEGRTGLVAALLLALSPLHIWYSQEIRAYIGGVTFSILSLLFLIKALKDPRPRWWIAHLTTTILCTLIFIPGGLFIVLVEDLFLALTWNKHKFLLKKWLICQAAMVALVGFGFLYYWKFSWRFTIARLGSGEHWVGSGLLRLIPIGYTFFTFSLGLSLGPSVAQLQVSRSLAQLVPFLPLLISMFLLFSFLFGRGIKFLFGDKTKLIFLLLYLFVPISILFLIANLAHGPFNVRYIILSLPAYILFLARGISTSDNRRWSPILLLLVALASVLSLNNYYYNSMYAKVDIRSAAKFIELKAKSRDVIVVTVVKAPFSYYYRGGLPIYGLHWVTEEQVRELSEKFAEHDRIWLVLSRTHFADPNDRLRRFCEKTYQEIAKKEFPGVRVHLYSNRAGFETPF